ncbi:MAG: citramalate synthase [Clostridiales bacterium 43-6]|nr:MAG: citramalate synthase [Clostridiales bacterium 43-6]
MKKAIDIFDSTLRDGAQGEGISFSVEDKLNIASALDELGIGYIEAGNPGSNPKDLEFFQRAASLNLKHSTLVAFGSTRRKNSKAEEDNNVIAMMTANTRVVAIFGKCWDLHVTEILNAAPEENLAMITDTVEYFVKNGKEVIFDGEHFFDGYKANPDYALEALGAAVKGGASCLTLCDTNGGSFPFEIEAAVKTVTERFPGVTVGIHCHNDGGLGVANSIAAVNAGATQVQGTYLGFGERTGNANLSTIIANLQLKLGYRCIPEETMQFLTTTAMEIAEISNITLNNNEPFVGLSAFAHKAGMHADGVMKCSESFEHINPAAVGNERRFLVSEISGKTAILKKISKFAPDMDKNSPYIKEIIDQLKELEHKGYQFEGAEGSFRLLVQKILGNFTPSFDLVSYKVLDELPYDNNFSATTTIKVKVDGQLKVAAAEGDGPVNALDKALREALGTFYPSLSHIHLIDYKVRVMEPREATAAVVRVLITSTDGNSIWSTVGVSSDIIEASWLALVDSIEYKLNFKN